MGCAANLEAMLRKHPVLLGPARRLRRLVYVVSRFTLVPLIVGACEFGALALRLVPDDRAYRTFYRHGFHLLRRNYNLPIPEESDLSDEFLARESDLVGMEMNEGYALDLLRSILSKYVDEFRGSFALQPTSPDPKHFYLINSTFMAVDAHVYYSFIRHFKPEQIVEIGAGNSTLLAAAACRRNLEEWGKAPRLVAIEPFPGPLLREGIPGLTQLVQEKVEKVGIDLVGSLKAGDILFIDSSHALRSGGDVQFEYCEVLPRLAPGVLVHIHDIGLPRPYPRTYFDNHLYWNEQYLLQAFLCFNYRFEVIWPGAYMMSKHGGSVAAVFPEYHEMRKFYPLAVPSSFWMRVK